MLAHEIKNPLSGIRGAAQLLETAVGDEDRALTRLICDEFRPGVRIRVPGATAPVSLPLEFCVRDNGPGVPPDIAEHLFDPFVTTKSSGTGLGLALVAKLIGDHGGTVECESYPRRTTFRVLMPMFAARDGRGGSAP